MFASQSCCKMFFSIQWIWMVVEDKVPAEEISTLWHLWLSVATSHSGWTVATYLQGYEQHVWPGPRFIGYSSAWEDTTSPSTKTAMDLPAMIDFTLPEVWYSCRSLAFFWQSFGILCPGMWIVRGYHIAVSCYSFHCQILVPLLVGPLVTWLHLSHQTTFAPLSQCLRTGSRAISELGAITARRIATRGSGCNSQLIRWSRTQALGFLTRLVTEK